MSEIKNIFICCCLTVFALVACDGDNSSEKDTPGSAKYNHPWEQFGEKQNTELIIFEPGEVPYEPSVGAHVSAAREPRIWRLDEQEKLHVDVLRQENPDLAKPNFGYEAQVFLLDDRLAYQISRRTHVKPWMGAGGYADYSGTLTVFNPNTFKISKIVRFDSYLDGSFPTRLFALRPDVIYAHYGESRTTYEVDVLTGKRGKQIEALKGMMFESVYKYGNEVFLDNGYSLVSWHEGATDVVTHNLGGTLRGVVACQDDLLICNVEQGGIKTAIYSLKERKLVMPLLKTGGKLLCAFYDATGVLYYCQEGTDSDIVFRADVSKLIGDSQSFALVESHQLAYISFMLDYIVAGPHSLYVSPDNRRLYVVYTYGVPVYSEARVAIYDLDTSNPKYPLVPRKVHSVSKIYKPAIWRVANTM